MICPSCKSSNVVSSLYDDTADCIDCLKHFNVNGPWWVRWFNAVIARREGEDRICDWFGPSDFDAARRALSRPSSSPGPRT